MTGELDMKDMIWTPSSPYERPGIFDAVDKQVGAACEAKFEKFTQMLLPMMYSKSYIKGNVAANGDPIIFSAITTPLTAFSIGAGATGTGSGIPATIQGGTLTTADTSVATPKQNNSASVAPANNMLFTGTALQCSMMSAFRVATDKIAVGTGWLKPYLQTMYQALAELLTISIVFGPTTTSQLIGPPRLYMDVSLQQGDYNSRPGSPVFTNCKFRSGAPNDSDQMSMQIAMPYPFQVDPLSTSTTQAGDIYVPLMIGLYGLLGCKTDDSGDACPAPMNAKQIQSIVQNAIDQYTKRNG